MPLPQGIRTQIKDQARSLLETGSRYKGFDQVRQRHFWSNLCFLPNANGYIPSGTYKAFITPSGQVGQGFPVALTELETNWKSANRVPDNQNFEVLEVGCTIAALPSFVASNGTTPYQVQPPFARQQAGIQQCSVLSIQYLTNEVPIGLLNDFQQASGPMPGGFSSVLNVPNPADGLNAGGVAPHTTQERYITNGFAAPGLRRRFKIPILLQHGETFSFNVTIPRTFYYGPQIQTVGEVEYINGYVLRIDFWATESFAEKS